MDTVLRQTIRDAYLAIDNKSFVDCTLTNCTLEYSGDPVSFNNTRLNHCKYSFLGPAKRTVMFLQESGLMPFDPADWGEFEGREQARSDS